MRSLNFWKKVSKYSTYLALLGFIVLTFFNKQVQKKYLDIISYIGIVVLIIFLISQLMKFIIKRKSNE